ncbi:hypothetical protein [Peterkaempfera bronchialis]
MVTESWALLRDGIAALWQQIYPGQGEVIARDLDAIREEMRNPVGEDAPTAEVVQQEWRRRLRRHLEENPELVPQLEQLLDSLQVAAPAPRQVHQTARATGGSTVNQAGGNITIVTTK